jgi:pimeloyl-ACP methyl ester carboxylesterase
VDGLSRDLAVIAVDLPGHGSTKPVPDPSIRRYAATVTGLLEHIGRRKVFLGGHSMGGAVALQVALEHPELLKGLILIGTTAFKGMFFSNGVAEDALAIARSDVRRCSLETVLGDFAACRHFDVRGHLKGIKVPTLVLCGKEDHITPPRHSKHLHREIRGSSFLLIPKAGHMLPLEAPAQVNAAIHAFVRKH